MRPSTGYWHGHGRNTNRGKSRDTRHNVHEVEAQDTSKPITDTTNSDVDVVKLLQAYGMVNSEGSELRHRKCSRPTLITLMCRQATLSLMYMWLILHPSHWSYMAVL